MCLSPTHHEGRCRIASSHGNNLLYLIMFFLYWVSSSFVSEFSLRQLFQVFTLKKHPKHFWLLTIKFGGLRPQREVEEAGGVYSLLGRHLRIASDLCRPQRPRRWGRCGSRGWPTCAKTCGSHGQTWCRRNNKKFTRLKWKEKVCCANISYL